MPQDVEVVCVVKRTYYLVVNDVTIQINERKADQISEGKEIREISERVFKENFVAQSVYKEPVSKTRF